MGNDDQKVITFDFCFTVQITYLKSYSKKRKIFWVDLHILMGSPLYLGLFHFNFWQEIYL